MLKIMNLLFPQSSFEIVIFWLICLLNLFDSKLSIFRTRSNQEYLTAETKFENKSTQTHLEKNFSETHSGNTSAKTHSENNSSKMSTTLRMSMPTGSTLVQKQTTTTTTTTTKKPKQVMFKVERNEMKVEPSPMLMGPKIKKPPKNKSNQERDSFDSGVILDSCIHCYDGQHVSDEGNLTFEEFHDLFFHSQYPHKTIILCDISVQPSGEKRRVRFTSCGKFTQENNTERHAEEFFVKYVEEKLTPRLIDQEEVSIKLWMNYSPCNLPDYNCSKNILSCMKDLKRWDIEPSLTVVFSHLNEIEEMYPKEVRKANSDALLLLLMDRDTELRPFNGYDWMELLFQRTPDAKEFLSMDSEDIQELLESRKETDKVNRAYLSKVLKDHRKELNNCIGIVNQELGKLAFY